MKVIKVEWCESWIKSKFAKHPLPNGGFEAGHFWNMAEAAGLWERGTYGTPMSEALSRLTKVETIHDVDGSYLYSVFRLAQLTPAPDVARAERKTTC